MVSASAGPIKLDIQIANLTNCSDKFDVCLYSGSKDDQICLTSNNCLYEINQNQNSTLLGRYKNVTLKIHDQQEEAQYEDYQETFQINQLKTIKNITLESKRPDTKDLALTFIDSETGEKIESDVSVSSIYNFKYLSENQSTVNGEATIVVAKNTTI